MKDDDLDDLLPLPLPLVAKPNRQAKGSEPPEPPRAQVTLKKVHRKGYSLAKTTAFRGDDDAIIGLVFSRRKTIQDLTRRFYSEEDDEIREDIRRILIEHQRGEEEAYLLLKDHSELEHEMRRHWENFNTGTHPQERELRRTAQYLGIPELELTSELDVFAKVAMAFRNTYHFLGKSIRDRDKQFLSGFMKFLRGKHDLQEEIEEALANRGLSGAVQNRQDLYRGFVSVAKESRELAYIREGLEAEDTRQVIADLEKKAEKHAQQAERNAQQATGAEFRAAQAQGNERRVVNGMIGLVEKIAAIDGARRNAETDLFATSREVTSLRLELSTRIENEERNIKRLATNRERIMNAAREYVRDLSKRAQNDEGHFFHRKYGVLFAEAQRRLRHELEEANSQWKGRGASGERTLRVIGEMITETDEFEECYMSPGCITVVSELNRYLAGATSLPAALVAVSNAELSVLMLEATDMQDTTDLVEAWLKPHRSFQRNALREFAGGIFRYQEAAKSLLDRVGAQRVPNDQVWIETWDENPWVFVCSNQEPLTGDQNTGYNHE